MPSTRIRRRFLPGFDYYSVCRHSKTTAAPRARSDYLRAISECGGNPSLLIPALAFLQSDGEGEIFRQYTASLCSLMKPPP